jgi:hypothetical protein
VREYRAMRRFAAAVAPTLALLLGTLAASAVGLGCEKEKSKVEQLAEQMASANSASASVSASAAPDPAELQYRERKAALEKAITDKLIVEGQIMRHENGVSFSQLKGYFADGAEGDKAARDLEAKRKKDGDDGYSVKKGPKFSNVILKGTMDEASVSYVEETEKKGLSACLQYDQTWKWTGSKWLFSAQKTVTKVDCE